MSSSPVESPPPPSPVPSPPALTRPAHASTPTGAAGLNLKRPQPPLSVILPPSTPATPSAYVPGEPTLTPPPRSPGSAPPAGDGKQPDGTSSDKSSETAVVSRTPSTGGALSRKESYKAQRQHYRREKKRAASALLHSIEDPSVVVLADWLKVRGSLKSWTKLWCVLKPGLLLLYKSPKAKSSHWVGTVLLASCQVIERPSKKDGFCFKLYHPLEQSIWAPRGPHNEAIGAVVQPLPTAHLIFRAPSQAAGHCWLDGLELALRCSNAMLRCSMAGASRAAPAGESPAPLSHEELERHFNEHGAKTDSENDDYQSALPKKRVELPSSSEVICTSPDNIVITKTAPSVERFRRYSSSSTDEVCDDRIPQYLARSSEKFSLIDCRHLPSATLEAITHERRDHRMSSQSVYVAGTVVGSELAGAESDSESEGMQEVDKGAADSVQGALQRLQSRYTEDPFKEVGSAGELVEEVAEENKSLLWFLLKQVRPGMDLSKVVLPTFILEPRSFLDKLSDSHYHANILAHASTIADPYDRFVAVVRWFMSGLYRKPKGLKKPYNPVLGESFRCYWTPPAAADDITYYVAEQVSHHPPVSAFYVSNRKSGFVIEGSLLARSKFYGNSTSAILEGCARVHLLNWNETYFTTAPYAHCKGIVMGSLSMEYGGKVQVICEQTGYHADIEFKLRSFLGGSEQTNYVKGHIKKGKDTLATLEGYWDTGINMKDKRSGEDITLIDVPTLKTQRLTRYLVRLEQQHEFESQRLWSKVSEAIDRDDQVAATEQKTIIEQEQRVRAKSSTAPWTPRYFHRDDALDAPQGLIDQKWRYNHVNITPWQPHEKMEYEEEFVISSITEDGAPAAAAAPVWQAALPRAPSLHAAASDTDTRADTQRRSKTTVRTLKTSLQAVDVALREQTAALDRLAKTVQGLSEGQRVAAAPYRPQSVGRAPAAAHGWDILVGFVIAVVLQALLNRLFYLKD